jgi:zinc and cadmium transporter
VAVADLIPQLQKRLSWRDTAIQIFWLAAGLLMIWSIVGQLHGSEEGHGHGHEHAHEAVQAPAGVGASGASSALAR